MQMRSCLQRRAVNNALVNTFFINLKYVKAALTLLYKVINNKLICICNSYFN